MGYHEDFVFRLKLCQIPSYFLNGCIYVHIIFMWRQVEPEPNQ